MAQGPQASPQMLWWLFVIAGKRVSIGYGTTWAGSPSFMQNQYIQESAGSCCALWKAANGPAKSSMSKPGCRAKRMSTGSWSAIAEVLFAAILTMRGRRCLNEMDGKRRGRHSEAIDSFGM